MKHSFAAIYAGSVPDSLHEGCEMPKMADSVVMEVSHSIAKPNM